MVERIYIRGRPEQLREAVRRDGFVKHFPRIYYYKKSDTHLIVKYEFITSGINKTSGKRYYNFKVNRIDSFKIVDGPGRKFLNCYSITFPGKPGSNRRGKLVKELNPRDMFSGVSDLVLRMCKEFIGDSPYETNILDALLWYWKPLYVFIKKGAISHHKELRGISARTSSLEDLSMKIFGSDSEHFVDSLRYGVKLSEVVPCISLFKRLDQSSDKYPEFAQRLVKMSNFSGKEYILLGAEHVPDMYLEKIVYECGELYLENLGLLCKFVESIDFSEDVSTLTDKLLLSDILCRNYNRDFDTNVDKELFHDFGFNVVENNRELIPFVYNNQDSDILGFYRKNTTFLIYEGDTLLRMDEDGIIDGIIHADGSSVDDSEVRELQNVIHTALT